MKKPLEVGTIVTYIGSDDEWNHEECKGAEYRITKVYPLVRRIYYYDLETTEENYDLVKHSFYDKLSSVRDYQVKPVNNKEDER